MAQPAPPARGTSRPWPKKSAGLADLDGVHVQGELSLAAQSIDFTRAGACASRPCPTVGNSNGPFPNTLDGVSVALRPGLVVAASVYGPPSVGRENFPDPRTAPGSPLSGAPQRYSLISENNVVVYPGLGVGFRALPWLSLGAVAQLRYFRARQTQSIYALGGVGGEYSELDAISAADARDPMRLVFGFGIIARPLPGLSIGLSARPAEPVHATGTLQVALPPFARAAGASVSGDAARLDFELPPEARLGVRYGAGAAAVLADLVWQNWGVLQNITVTPLDIVIHQGGNDFHVQPIVVPRSWHAAFSGRLGGEYAAFSFLTLRLGALYESSAIPDQTLQVDFVSPARFAATAGVTARCGAASLTAGYAHSFAASRDVTGSRADRIDPFPAPAFPVGNGVYQASLDVLAVQLSIAL